MSYKLFRIIGRKMSTNVTFKVQNKVEKAEKLVAELKTKLEEVKNYKVAIKIDELTKENETLLTHVEKAKVELIRLETLHGKKQYPLPDKVVTNIITLEPTKPKENVEPGETQLEKNVEPDQTKSKENVEPVIKKEKKEIENKKIKENPAPAAKKDTIVDIRLLDLRIGKIVDVKKHPDADSLYVERIDCGEGKPRTVISGLVKHVPIDEMRDKLIMVVCNLKPVKMRGITSEAMVMCASSPEKIELVIPPNGSVPGDLVFCEGYPREPEPQLNPKKKVFETCVPDIKTNDEKIVCYKGSPLVVPGKGQVKAPTLKGVIVK